MKFAKVRAVKSPVRGTAKSAGIDFFIPKSFKKVLYPGEDVLIPSGIKIDVPKGFMLMAANKSGVVTSRRAVENAGRVAKKEAFNSIITVGACIVDEDYQGEVHIHLINCGTEPVVLCEDIKIAQFILVPVLYASLEEVNESELFNEPTSRGEGGIGLGTGND